MTDRRSPLAPWLRTHLTLRVMLHTRWSAEASTILFALAVLVFGFPGAVSLAAEPDAAEPPAFFDPLAAIAPSITREVTLLVVRASAHRDQPDRSIVITRIGRS